MAGNQEALCMCPLRPFYTQGSMASGSQHESALLRQWEAEHGRHPYAKARDELAGAMQGAEAQVHSGEAVLRMAKEILGAPR